MRNFTTLFLLALTAGCVGLTKDWPNVQSGEKAAEPVIMAIKAYRTAHGKYPKSFDALSLPEKVMEDARDRNQVLATNRVENSCNNAPQK